MRRPRSIALVLTVLLAAVPVAAQQEPELPTGLDEPDEPALPPGLGEAPSDESEDADAERSLEDRLPEGLHGFWEVRAGPRTGSDPVQSDAFTLGESRLQVEYTRPWRRLTFDLKADLVADAVADEIDLDPRQLRLSARPGRAVDLRIGRQVLTWGTGDLLFVNDLFPKDWRSFFIGRDREYLKAPSDAVRVGWYTAALNVELVYTPQFDPDRYIRGERISFFSPLAGGFVGDAAPVRAVRPDDWLDDDETALRIYRSFGAFETALYGYRGFWKSPGGLDPVTQRATFPRLDVWGASVRGPVGPGIGNLELGFYDSRDDPDGRDPFVSNGELRGLVGYELELGRELTGGFQYYVERLLDYDDYRATLPAGEPRDQTRHLVTVRLTKLLMSQNLTLSLFAYLSPSDEDAYLRPIATYKLNDRWTVEAGANGFLGRDDHTFFGRFENNSNLYASLRFSI